MEGGGDLNRTWHCHREREAAVEGRGAAEGRAAVGTYLEPWASRSWERKWRHNRCRVVNILCHFMLTCVLRNFLSGSWWVSKHPLPLPGSCSLEKLTTKHFLGGQGLKAWTFSTFVAKLVDCRLPWVQGKLTS